MSTLLGTNDQLFKILMILIIVYIFLNNSCPFVPLKAYQLINDQKMYILRINRSYFLTNTSFLHFTFFCFQIQMPKSTIVLIIPYIFILTDLDLYLFNYLFYYNNYYNYFLQHFLWIFFVKIFLYIFFVFIYLFFKIAHLFSSVLL